MCDFGCGIWEDAKNEGRIESAKESALRFSKMGLSPEAIAEGVGFDLATVKEWLKGAVPA